MLSRGGLMARTLALLSMLVRENFVPGQFSREAEPNAAMDTPEQVDAFDSQGVDDGPMASIYQLTAAACSRLTPRGGIVVDLGCGTGRFAAVLAGLRQDLRVVGYDLSPLMAQTGNARLRALGLHDRVELREGDMTSFAERIPAETSLVNCLFALHHLPTLDHVRQTLTEIRLAVARTECGFFILDLVRPCHRSTAAAYPRVFMPDSPSIFQADTMNSLIAAYDFSELSDAVNSVFGPGEVRSIRSRILPLYQAYWRVKPFSRDIEQRIPALPTFATPSKAARRQLRALRFILPGLPE